MPARHGIPGHELHSAISKDVHSSLVKHGAKHEFLKASLEHIANIQPGHKPTEKELANQAKALDKAQHEANVKVAQEKLKMHEKAEKQKAEILRKQHDEEQKQINELKKRQEIAEKKIRDSEEQYRKNKQEREEREQKEKQLQQLRQRAEMEERRAKKQEQERIQLQQFEVQL